MEIEKLELKEGMFFKIKKGESERVFHAYYNGEDYASEIPLKLREEAFEKGLCVLVDENKQFVLSSKNFVPQIPDNITMDFIQICYQYKPENLFLSEVKWKVVMRNIIKSRNILVLGHSGSGKTVMAKTAAKVLKRPFFKFNMGSMQDPRAALIGNTFFNAEKGTYFNESEFVKAIQTPNAVILLDELTRAHPDANNILITVLDQEQRYLRLDEKDGQEVIIVADGVSFIATANIGNEYTGTRVLDRATLDRFSLMEMSMLSKEEELELMKMEFNVENELLELLVKVAAGIRDEFLNEDGKISTMMSTRMVKDAAGYMEDGFTIAEALEVTVLPLYDEQGGASSERQVIKQIIDSIIPKADELDAKLFDSGISANNPFIGALKNIKVKP